MTTRTRDEIVADIDRLLFELEAVREETDSSWMVQDWAIVERWQRITPAGKLTSAFVLETRDEEPEAWLIETYLRQGLKEVDFDSAAPDED